MRNRACSFDKCFATARYELAHAGTKLRHSQSQEISDRKTLTPGFFFLQDVFSREVVAGHLARAVSALRVPWPAKPDARPLITPQDVTNVSKVSSQLVFAFLARALSRTNFGFSLFRLMEVQRRSVRRADIQRSVQKRDVQRVNRSIKARTMSSLRCMLSSFCRACSPAATPVIDAPRRLVVQAPKCVFPA